MFYTFLIRKENKSMNKNRFNNITFIFLITLIILISLAAFSISLKIVSFDVFTETMNKGISLIYTNIIDQIILGLIALLLFLIAIYLIQKRKQFNLLSLSVIKKTSYGEVKISLESLNYLIIKILKKAEEIKESKSFIRILKTGGISIDLHLVLKQDVNIPEISEKIQKELKDYLMETSGIEAEEVKIYIDKVFYDGPEMKK